MNPRNLSFGLMAVLGIVADQVSKRWVVANFEAGVDEWVLIPNFLSIVHAQNTGAAFSTMEGARWVFIAFTVVAVVVVLDMVRRQRPTEAVVPLSLGMIIAGAVGNGIDRLFVGHVTDMVKSFAGFEPLRSWCIEQFGTNVWPIYNIADSLLLIGVGTFTAYFLFQREGEPVVDDDEAPAAS